MADNRFSCNSPHGTVCVDLNRVYDCCRDRDCFENSRVLLTGFGNDLVGRTGNIRVKDACIAWTYIGIEPIPFNRGFYTVSIKFFIRLTMEACMGPGRAQEFDGITVLEKKVVLFGSESNVHVFKSNSASTDFCAEPQACHQDPTAPEAVVEVVDPIILGVRVVDDPGECHCCCCCTCSDVPEPVSNTLSGPVSEPGENGRYLAVSIGLFSVVRLERPAQYLINATEYAVPEKECVTGGENDPCSLFRTMSFPVAEFDPPSFPVGGTGGCGCNGIGIGNGNGNGNGNGLGIGIGNGNGGLSPLNGNGNGGCGNGNGTGGISNGGNGGCRNDSGCRSERRCGCN